MALARRLPVVMLSIEFALALILRTGRQKLGCAAVGASS